MSHDGKQGLLQRHMNFRVQGLATAAGLAHPRSIARPQPPRPCAASSAEAAPRALPCGNASPAAPSVNGGDIPFPGARHQPCAAQRRPKIDPRPLHVRRKLQARPPTCRCWRPGRRPRGVRGSAAVLTRNRFHIDEPLASAGRQRKAWALDLVLLPLSRSSTNKTRAPGHERASTWPGYLARPAKWRSSST